MLPDSPVDFAVIGAGIAGASVASRLAERAKVVLLEREAQPGYHTTGRSAAMFEPAYGPAPIRALTRASADFFNAPPQGFCAGPLLSPRAGLFLARADQVQALAGFLAELGANPGIERLTAAELEAKYPLLKPGYAAAGAYDPVGADIDVHALLAGFLATVRAAGGQVVTKAEVQSLTRQSGLWDIQTSAGVVQAKAVINASGAWADQIGALAGAETIGLTPCRRTALLVDPPEGLATQDLPLIVDIDEAFYLKPDAGRLLISPANEDPEAPCDVQPDELDVALCVDRIQQAFNLPIRRIAHKWAGLRSFVADKAPVVGWSQRAEGFFWLAGQGGYGIQSSPALSRYAAALALGEALPADILAEGLEPDSIAVARLAN